MSRKLCYLLALSISCSTPYLFSASALVDGDGSEFISEARLNSVEVSIQCDKTQKRDTVRNNLSNLVASELTPATQSLKKLVFSGEGLPPLQFLKKLILQDVQLAEAQDDFTTLFRCFVRSLQMPDLDTLDLSNTQLLTGVPKLRSNASQASKEAAQKRDDDVESAARELVDKCQNLRVSVLRLSDCSIGSIFFESFSKQIQAKKWVPSKLDLSYNCIPIDAAANFVLALRNSNSISTIVFEGNTDFPRDYSGKSKQYTTQDLKEKLLESLMGTLSIDDSL